MSTILIDAIAQKAADQDGLTTAEQQEIKNQFASNPADLAKVNKVLSIFSDLVVDRGERRRLVTLLGLDASAQRALDIIIGSDGKELLRQHKQHLRISKLITMLGDRDVGVYVAASRELIKIGSMAVPALISALDNSNKQMREEAVKILGEIKDLRAVPKLSILLLNDSSNNVRLFAAQTLGLIGNSGAIQPLSKALNDRDLSTRGTAVGALAKINDPRAESALIAALANRWGNVRMDATSVLCHLKATRAIKPLIALLNNERDKVVRDHVARELRKWNEPSIAAALRAAGY